MTSATVPASGGRETAGSRPAFDSTRAWRLSSRVAVRPEPFGALLYDFGTRKLSFLKNLVIVDVVRSLHEHPSVDAALAAAGVSADDSPRYLRALAALSQSGMLIPAAPEE